ncbi:MAG: septum formation initiator family protein [Clostridiales bacterium]|nr:septum formation initiator family protein [Candidatus Equinaster intestinalis]
MKNTARSRSSIILRCMGFALAVYIIVSLSILWSELVSKQTELNKLKDLRTQKAGKIASITAMLDGSEKEIIEKAARERLGFVYANEQVYRDKSGN